MPMATPDPRLLFAIDKLEQSLVMLRTDRPDEAALRKKIEEAIEAGHDVAYSRPTSRLGRVLGFPDRRRSNLRA